MYRWGAMARPGGTTQTACLSDPSPHGKSWRAKASIQETALSYEDTQAFPGAFEILDTEAGTAIITRLAARNTDDPLVSLHPTRFKQGEAGTEIKITVPLL